MTENIKPENPEAADANREGNNSARKTGGDLGPVGLWDRMWVRGLIGLVLAVVVCLVVLWATTLKTGSTDENPDRVTVVGGTATALPTIVRYPTTKAPAPSVSGPGDNTPTTNSVTEPEPVTTTDTSTTQPDVPQNGETPTTIVGTPDEGPGDGNNVGAVETSYCSEMTKLETSLKQAGITGLGAELAGSKMTGALVEQLGAVADISPENIHESFENLASGAYMRNPQNMDRWGQEVTEHQAQTCRPA